MTGRVHFWRIDNKPGAGWGLRVRIGRCEVGYLIYKHVYGKASPDRWVFKPSLVWDRKRKVSP